MGPESLRLDGEQNKDGQVIVDINVCPLGLLTRYMLTFPIPVHAIWPTTNHKNTTEAYTWKP